jgi:CspA family cold shock protein
MAHTGKIAWFNKAKGFGFIAGEGGTNIFCPSSSIQSNEDLPVKEGILVEFDVVKGMSGRFQAANVIPVR